MKQEHIRKCEGIVGRNSHCGFTLQQCFSVHIYILLCWGSGDAAFGMRCRRVSEIEVQDLLVQACSEAIVNLTCLEL